MQDEYKDYKVYTVNEMLARFSVGLSLAAITGLFGFVMQFSSYATTLEDTVEEVDTIKQDLRVIRKDLTIIQREQAVTNYILRSLAAQANVDTPPPHADGRRLPTP
jgi:hypothetical protein